MAPWHGGSATLTTEFIKKYPAETKKYIAAYATRHRARAQQAGRSAPVPEGLHRHRRPADRRGAAGLVHALQRVQAERRRYFQKFYDLFTEKGIFEKKVVVDSLLYKG
jgi:NitT/TauT family transport system substrate-binding protein